jgi:hypothetical protein
MEGLHQLQKKAFLGRVSGCEADTILSFETGPMGVLNININSSMLVALIVEVEDLGYTLIR